MPDVPEHKYDILKKNDQAANKNLKINGFCYYFLISIFLNAANECNCFVRVNNSISESSRISFLAFVLLFDQLFKVKSYFKMQHQF